MFKLLCYGPKSTIELLTLAQYETFLQTCPMIEFNTHTVTDVTLDAEGLASLTETIERINTNRDIKAKLTLIRSI